MDLEHFPKSEAANRMLSYVTKGWYDRSYVGKWIFEILGKEVDTAEKLVDELPYQFFVDTATWGLRYHELKYGLPVREDLSYEERRALIKLKRDSQYSMTPYRMESILFDQFGVEVHVNDTNDSGGFAFEHPNIFSVTFVQDGDGKEFDTLKAKVLIDKLKLSHTLYHYRYWLMLEVTQKVECDISLELCSKVSVWSDENYGYEEIFLDGKYLLDGSIWLNGYKDKRAIGRYIEADAEYGMKYETAPVYAGGITVGKNLWYLNGEYRLDGQKLLNAEEYEISL
ncbi:MAG TPA: YmfQ family protein [Candidatus Blautia faecavium]|uniref:YmfQ family protein n=1 Tax=Candidatus Blautia faecavium TaxID=2838487 RepID=A0A9D2LUW5_9FIRM|nr:YmfQ family protein [Candidatus Blautia faecavium]